METLTALEQRRSCRKFDPDKMVEKEVLEKIIKAGTYAPSGMGRQSSIILAVTDKETRDMLSKLNASIMGRTGDPFYGAPVVLVVLASKEVPTHVYDGSLVMGNLLNAAADQGVDSIWIHRAKESFDAPEGKELLKKLGIEGEYEGIGNCALGYRAADIPEAAPRKENYVYYL